MRETTFGRAGIIKIFLQKPEWHAGIEFLSLSGECKDPARPDPDFMPNSTRRVGTKRVTLIEINQGQFMLLRVFLFCFLFVAVFLLDPNELSFESVRFIGDVLGDNLTHELVWRGAGRVFNPVSREIAVTCPADERPIVINRVGGEAGQSHEARTDTENAIHLNADADSANLDNELAKLAVERNVTAWCRCLTFKNATRRVMLSNYTETGPAVEVGGQVVGLFVYTAGFLDIAGQNGRMVALQEITVIKDRGGHPARQTSCSGILLSSLEGFEHGALLGQ